MLDRAHETRSAPLPAAFVAGPTVPGRVSVVMKDRRRKSDRCVKPVGPQDRGVAGVAVSNYSFNIYTDGVLPKESHQS
jgi:hypothetical protein